MGLILLVLLGYVAVGVAYRAYLLASHSRWVDSDDFVLSGMIWPAVMFHRAVYDFVYTRAIATKGR